MRKLRNNGFLIFILVFSILCGIRLKKLFSVYQTFKFYEKEIDRLKKENQILIGKIEKVKNNPFYVEKILRENFGMIKDGEYIIKIEQ